MELAIPVLYIVGCAHSGSTILNMALGSHPQIEGVGELANLVSHAWIKDEYCSCKRRGNACPLWSEVKREWMAQTGLADLSTYEVLRTRFERMRNLPRLLSEKYRLSADFSLYAECTHALFTAIIRNAHKSLIVDASKNPMRALALSMIPGLDLYLLHLIRDGRGVAWSFAKSRKRDEIGGVQRDTPSFPVWRTALSWNLVNVLAERVANAFSRDRFVRIRYEDFAASPGETLRAIDDVLGLGSLEREIDCEKIYPRHTVAGNRLRMRECTRLALDREWISKLSERDRRVVWTMCGWLLHKYGYPKEAL